MKSSQEIPLKGGDRHDSMTAFSTICALIRATVFVPEISGSGFLIVETFRICYF